MIALCSLAKALVSLQDNQIIVMVVMKSMTINSWKMMQIRFINIGWLLLTGKLHDNYVMRFDGKPFDFGRKISLKTKESFPSITEESTLATSFFNDEEYRDMALQWVQPNSYSKGTPNMTAKRLRGWVNYPLLTVVVQYHPQVPEQISTCTPIHWLHVSHHKHTGEEVVQYHKLYLRKLEILESTHIHPPPLQ